MKLVKSQRSRQFNARSKRVLCEVIDSLESRLMLSATIKAQIPSPTLNAGGTVQTLNLGAYFDDPTIPTGDIAIEIETNLPSPNNLIPMVLTETATPNTVANFLNYISNGEYTNTIFHRSVPQFIIQGGGYNVDGSQIASLGRISSEASTETLTNTPGTIAMALSTGPNTATSEWFFNLVNNNGTSSPYDVNLNDSSDGGPFTVFGQVIYQGLSVLDNIAALPVVDDTANGAWNSLPVQSGTNGATVSSEAESNLITTTPVEIPTGLVYTVNSSNTSVVTATTSEGNLTITPVAAGTATITVTGEDLGLGTVSQSFTVTVDSTTPRPVVYLASTASGTAGTNSTINFPITLSNASSTAITLDYSLTSGTAPSTDFQASASTLTIPAGATSATIPVTLVKDSTGAAETFTLTLSSLSSNAVFGSNAATETSTGTINPAQAAVPKVSIGNAAGTLGTNGQIVFPVTLSAASTSATTLHYTLAPASATTADYQAIASTLSIPQGSTTATIPVTLLGDSTGEVESFTITLSGLSTNAVFASGTATESAIGIINPAGTVTPTLAIGNASGTVGTQVNFPVTLSAASATATTLDYTLTAGTAPSTDYQTSGTSLTIPAGSTTATIPVTILANSTDTAETFTLTLSNLSSNVLFSNSEPTESATGTIEPLAPTTTTLTPASPVVAINGSETFTATVVVTATGAPASGNVTFENAGVSIGTAALTNGVATLTANLSTAGDETFTAEYAGDSSHAASTSTTATVNVATLAPSVAKSTVPNSAVAGTAVKGTTTIALTNDTATAETGNVTIDIYASTDGVIDSSSVLVATVTRKENIAPGKTVNVPVTVSSLLTSLASGTYKLLGESIDTSRQISKSSTGPSLTLATPVVALSETFTKLTVPASVVAGAKTGAAAVLKITNNGNIISTGVTTVDLYASTDGTTTNATLITSVAKKLSIKPGKSVSVTIPLGKYPLVVNGSYQIVAQVTDPKANVTTKAFPTPVTIAAANIDLAATFASVPATATIGKSISVTLEVTNDGNTTAAGLLDIAFSASPTNTGANAFQLGNLTQRINLKPGKKITLHLKVPVATGTTAGQQFLVAVVDPNDVFNSSGVTNNTAISTTAITLG